MLCQSQAETDRPHGHAGHPQPYLQHRKHQKAPNDLAAGAHPLWVIIPTRSAQEAKHSPFQEGGFFLPFFPKGDPFPLIPKGGSPLLGQLFVSLLQQPGISTMEKALPSQTVLPTPDPKKGVNSNPRSSMRIQ